MIPASATLAASPITAQGIDDSGHVATRVALVARRFWPLSGTLDAGSLRLALALQARDAAVSVVSARWHATWPERFVFRGIPVHRLQLAGTRGLSSYRYEKALRKWLRQRASELDVVCVAGLGRDAVAVTDALRGTSVAVIVRIDSSGPVGEGSGRVATRYGRLLRRKCAFADGFVATSDSIREGLVLAGYDGQRVHRIDDGWAGCVESESIAGSMARQVFADVNASLALPAGAPMAVVFSELRKAAGLEELIRAWEGVVRCLPSARLWLIGNGAGRRNLENLVARLDLGDRVLLPGSFDAIDDLIQAANVLIEPGVWDHSLEAVHAAQTLARPVLAIDTPTHREALADGCAGVLVPAGDRNALTDSIVQLFRNPNECKRLGVAGQSLVYNLSSHDKWADQHLHLFRKLALQKAED